MSEKILIGVISDTHLSGQNKELPQKLLDGLKNVDILIHTGDFVDNNVYNKLKKMAPKFIGVAGNMDSSEIKEKLPGKELVKIGKYTVGIYHGSGHPAGLVDLLKKIFKEDKVDIILFGHSHNPLNKQIDNILFFNPGSPTDKIFAPYNSFGLIEINDQINAKIVEI